MPVFDPEPTAVAPPDLVEEVLEAHHGDAEAAIAGLLDDVIFLQGQIAYASLAMSRGFTRGWKPSFRRIAENQREKDAS